LFYRLNVVPLRLPPLRERVEDIPDLMRHFFRQIQAEGLPAKTLNADAMERLKRHRWPGNVRELENLVRRLAALYSDEVIAINVIEAELVEPAAALAPGGAPENDNLGAAVETHLGRYFAAHGDRLPPDGLYDRIVREVERPLLALSLAATRGNQIRAARLLGLNRNTLRKKIRVLDLPVVRGLG
jgi:two-component system nitrogen regulation response regulator GlnG